MSVIYYKQYKQQTLIQDQTVIIYSGGNTAKVTTVHWTLLYGGSFFHYNYVCRSMTAVFKTSTLCYYKIKDISPRWLRSTKPQL